MCKILKHSSLKGFTLFMFTDKFLKIRYIYLMFCFCFVGFTTFMVIHILNKVSAVIDYDYVIAFDLNLNESEIKNDIDNNSSITSLLEKIPFEWGQSMDALNSTSFKLCTDCKDFAWQNPSYYTYYKAVSTTIWINYNYRVSLAKTAEYMKNFENEKTRIFEGFTIVLPTDLTLDNNSFSCGDKAEYLFSDSQKPHSGILIRANWAKAQVTTFDKDGGTGGEDTFHIFDGSIPTQKFEIPHKAGYKFIGYFYNNIQYIDENGYAVNEPNLFKNMPTTLYAKWALEQPAITLNCLNYTGQECAVALFNDNKMLYSIHLSEQTTILLPQNEDGTENKYIIKFLVNALSNLSFEKNSNITQTSNTSLIINTPTATTINFYLTIPNLNNHVVV